MTDSRKLRVIRIFVVFAIPFLFICHLNCCCLTPQLLKEVAELEDDETDCDILCMYTVHIKLIVKFLL